jgi:hypothetical protein
MSEVSMQWLTQAHQQTQNQLFQQYFTLLGRCQKDPNAAMWLRLMTYPMTYNADTAIEQERAVLNISQELHKIFYELTEYDFHTATTNPYHFQCDWIYFIDSFMGNYFYDDFYFSVFNRDSKSKYSIVEIAADTDSYVSQDPRELIIAAVKNTAITARLQKLPVVFNTIDELSAYLSS